MRLPGCLVRPRPHGTHVPTTTRNTLQHRNGTIVDPSYDWFVALRVLDQCN